MITPLILTFNEAPNIGRALEKLRWAKEIVVVDSFSTDETLEIVRQFPQARVVQRKFDNHTAQWNFGLNLITTDWVLSLDADYLLSDALVEEILGKVESRKQKSERGNLQEGTEITESATWGKAEMLKAEKRKSEVAGRRFGSAPSSILQLPSSIVAGYEARFRYCIQGRPLRASLYPPRVVLYRRDRAQYREDGHTQLLQIDGPVEMLSGYIDHDDRKPLERWFSEQLRYSAQEALHLAETPVRELNRADRMRRRIVLAPGLVFFYTLLGKGLILDGWAGWMYLFQRTVAEMILSMRIIQEKLKR